MRRAEVEALYQKLFGCLVRRIEYKHRLTVEDANDLVQDAFLLAIGKMGSEGNAAAWFVRVVDRLAANLISTRARRARLLKQWGPDAGKAVGESEEADS